MKKYKDRILKKGLAALSNVQKNLDVQKKHQETFQEGTVNGTFQ